MPQTRETAQDAPVREGKYHHGDLRRALIDAAVTLVAERGVDGLTLRAAARKVGVTHAAPYRHFRDKSDLIAAVAAEGFDLMVERMIEAREAAGTDPLARLQVIGVAYIEFALAFPSHFGVMFGPNLDAQMQSSPELGKSGRRAFGLLVDTIREGQASGVARAGDPHQLAVTAWAAVHGLSALLVNGLLGAKKGEETRALARMVTDHLHQGLGPR